MVVCQVIMLIMLIGYDNGDGFEYVYACDSGDYVDGCDHDNNADGVLVVRW